MITRKDLLSEIIERELAMFQSVNNRGGRADCQDMPESFRLMREITHAVLSVAFLESYGQDLRRAERDGRNFMTEKYAIMEGQIAPINPHPRTPEIADQETDRPEAAAKPGGEDDDVLQVEHGPSVSFSWAAQPPLSTDASRSAREPKPSLLMRRS